MVLIALLLAIGQFSALKIFDYFEREPRAQAAALQAVTVVNYTRASLLAYLRCRPAGDRRTLAERPFHPARG